MSCNRKTILSVDEASKFLKIDKNTLKAGLKSGTLPVGSAIITKHNEDGNPRYKYHIPLKKAEEYMGMEYTEE